MDQDIIERKPASPIATSLLVISAVCMMAAMTFMFIELRELKGDKDTPADNVTQLVKKGPQVKALATKVGEVVIKDDDTDSGNNDPDPGDSDPGDNDTDPGDDDKK